MITTLRSVSALVRLTVEHYPTNVMYFPDRFFSQDLAADGRDERI